MGQLSVTQLPLWVSMIRVWVSLVAHSSLKTTPLLHSNYLCLLSPLRLASFSLFYTPVPELTCSPNENLRVLNMHTCNNETVFCSTFFLFTHVLMYPPQQARQQKGKKKSLINSKALNCKKKYFFQRWQSLTFLHLQSIMTHSANTSHYICLHSDFFLLFCRAM